MGAHPLDGSVRVGVVGHGHPRGTIVWRGMMAYMA